jgi:acetylornithine deacetylase/succinyl-diaminopimelate desuccinylase-like protein
VNFDKTNDRGWKMACIEKTSADADTSFEELLCSQCSPEEILTITADLIRIESHRSAPAKESAAAEYIRDLFCREGIESELREVRPGRPNVIAVLRGHRNGPRLMLNGHTDTVPPGTMENAFSPRVTDGILSGRGACDMKAGLAAQICALVSLKRASVKLDGDLIFTGVIAEEDGTSLGSLDIVENGPRAEMVVVAEPTDLRVAIAHKGFDYYKIEVDGVAAHSSRPDKGSNAIYRAASIVGAIERHLIPEIASNRHPLLGSATVNVSSIIGCARSEAATAFGGGPVEKPAGGTVPDSCTICLDQRRLPGSSFMDIIAPLERLVHQIFGHRDAPVARVSFTPACPELESHPPLDTDAGHALVRECIRISSEKASVPPAPIGVPYWSDAALFSSGWNVPAIVFGPGDIAVAHSNDECVAVDQLVRAKQVNTLLAAALLVRDK